MRVIWSREAQDDVFGIAEYYDGIDPLLADSVVDRIEGAVVPLIDHPHIGPAVGDTGARKWRVARAPFIIFYVATEDRIDIQRVVHASSDWRD